MKFARDKVARATLSGSLYALLEGRAEELPKILDRLAEIAGSPIGPLKYSGVSGISANGVDLEFQLYCEGRYYMTLFRELNRELKLLCEDHEIAIAMNQVKMYEPKTDSEEKPEDA